MITADTITDEQIRELCAKTQAERKSLGLRASYDRVFALDQIEHHCKVALGQRRSHVGSSRASSRARCAEILNARGAK